jgi:iron complex transport system ATP-binding protein
MAVPAIEAKGIEFSYPASGPVLSGVDLGVDTGELVGVIGPNGSGKTTLLNILSRTLSPDRGEVRIFGDPASALSSRERARRLAMVVQEPRVAFPFTVLEIVLMGRAPYLGRWQLEAAGDVAKAREAIEMTGLGELAGRKFHELSGGERQRVMIAKALVQQSRILLLDEPTAFLDLKRQVEIYELVRELKRERGLAVIAVSHDVNLAAGFSDRIAVLADGVIAATGSPSQVLDPGLLKKVYGVSVGLAMHPARGEVPLVFPLSGQGEVTDGK